MKRTGLVGLTCLTALWFVSAVRLGFLDEYKKDDYRDAVAKAIELAGPNGNILWVADRVTGSYYGLGFGDEVDQIPRDRIFKAHCGINWKISDVAADFHDSTGAYIVAVSRPDVFDKKDGTSRWLKENGGVLKATLSAFRIYAVPRT